MHLNDFFASVKVGDESLEECNVDVSPEDSAATRVLRCYVASSKGQNFSLHYDNRSSQIYKVQTHVDGQLVDSCNFKPGTDETSSGPYVSETLRRPYCFSDLILVEEENGSSGQAIEALGLIEMRIYRLKRLRKRKAETFDGWAPEELNPVDERSKKVGTHCVSYGQAIEAPPVIMPDYTYKQIDPSDKPYMIFQFRYLPKDILQARGIVPPDPPRAQSSPVRPAPQSENRDTGNARKRPGVSSQPAAEPGTSSSAEAGPSAKRVKVEAPSSESEDDDEGLMSQLNAATANVAALRAKMENRKRKKQTKQKPLKREPSPITLVTNGEVIDLTSD